MTVVENEMSTLEIVDSWRIFTVCYQKQNERGNED